MTGGPLFSFESEAALIGAAMYAPDRCDAALESLLPEHFGDPVHGLIWQAICKVVRAGGAPTPEIIRDRIGTDPSFEEWGGFNLLWGLWDRANTAGVADHAEAVAERAGRRALKALLDELAPKISDTSAGGYVDLLGELEAGAAHIARSSTATDRWISAGDMVRDALAKARARSGKIEYPFGVKDVDDYVGGLNAGEATWIAARTGMGKTVAGMTIARANASKGLGVCFFSLEMSAKALGLRLAADVAFDRDAALYGPHSHQCNPTPDAAQKDGLSAAQWAQLEAAQEQVEVWPLFTDDRASLTIAQMEAAARRQHRRWERVGIKPGPVVIDHLGRVRPGKDRRGARHAEMADISNEASEMAKRLGVPVVGLVQLNRGVENREDKRPQLSDLRQAGELEEDARQVVFIYRPEYYLRPPPDGESFDQECERREKLKAVEKKMYWIVGKNSHGPLGEVLMAVLAAAIEADALTMRSKVWQQVNGMGGAATFRRVMEGRALLEQSLTPDGNRTALLNNLDNVDLVDALKGLFNAQGTISKQNREGMMGHTAGFDFFETTHLNRQARGPGASYLSNGATQTGAAISVDTGTGAINAGEIVTFAGVFSVHPETKAITNQLQQFVVTANHAGGTGVLAISPAIVVTGAEQNVSNAIADNSAMVIAGSAGSYGQSLVYHEDAFTLATADLVLPKGVDFGARENYDGISLRVIRDYDINSDSLPCRVDVLYGYEALRPELAARLAFN